MLSDNSDIKKAQEIVPFYLWYLNPLQIISSCKRMIQKKLRGLKMLHCIFNPVSFYLMLVNFAERKRFELSIPFRGIHAFQACLFNHSSTSPYFLEAQMYEKKPRYENEKD